MDRTILPILYILYGAADELGPGSAPVHSELEAAGLFTKRLTASTISST
nr:hypothetical protein [Tetragenococcus halophilus]